MITPTHIQKLNKVGRKKEKNNNNNKSNPYIFVFRNCCPPNYKKKV